MGAASETGVGNATPCQDPWPPPAAGTEADLLVAEAEAEGGVVLVRVDGAGRVAPRCERKLASRSKARSKAVVCGDSSNAV